MSRSLFAGEDEALRAARAEMARAGLPSINVSPTAGKLLHLLARLSGARRILEIGTLGGYSAIWLARALPPDGQLLSLELEERHAAVARANLQRAGLAERRRGARRAGAGFAEGAGGGRRGALRPDLHRRRQAGLSRLPGVVACG